MRTLVGLMVIAVAALRLSAQSWELQNPYPCNSTMRGLYFATADEGWMLTWVPGMIYHTTDGGTSWERQLYETVHPLMAFSFVDAEHGWAACDRDQLLHTSDGGSTWIWQDLGTDLSVQSVTFIDTLHGWVVGSTGAGAILRTVDGGQNWEIYSYGTNVTMYGITMADTMFGWAVGYDWIAQQGIILATPDGGETWIQQYQAGDHVYLYGCACTGMMDAWAIGDHWTGGGYEAMIYRTSDGGWTWDSRSVGLGPSQAISFGDPNHAWATAEWNTLVATADGGQTWTAQDLGITSCAQAPHAVFALDSNHVWAAAEPGIVTRSTDGGRNWTYLSRGATCHLYDIAFADLSNGWTVGDGGTVLHTTNGGQNWDAQNSGFGLGHWLHGVACTSPRDAWIVADHGVAKYTHDAGVGWQDAVLPPATDLSLWATTFSDPRNGWITGREGSYTASEPTIFHTSDGGAVWERQTLGPNASGCIYDVCVLDSATSWAVGSYGQIFHTTDGGQAWLPQASNTAIDLRSVSFFNAETGWVCGYTFGPSALLKTTNGGETWQTLPANEFFSLSDVWFLDEDNGWMFSAGIDFESNRSGTLRTTDGGNTWRTSTALGGYRFFFTDADNGWTSGAGGKIVHWSGSANVPENSWAVTPASYGLQVYPNPFNPTTTLSFDAATTGRAQIAVFDVLGQVVQVLSDQVYAPGTHRLIFDGSMLPSGVYFARLQTNSMVRTQKILLLK